ncbi:hypothetical protein ACJZ2D_015574 [Fusarium nematophilum]
MASGGSGWGQWVPCPCGGCSHRLCWSGDYWYCGNESCHYVNCEVSRDQSLQEWVQYPYTYAETYDLEPYYSEDQHRYYAAPTEDQNRGAQTLAAPGSDDVDILQPGPLRDADSTVYDAAQTDDYPPPSPALATVGSWPSNTEVESPTSAESSLANGWVELDDEERRHQLAGLVHQEASPYTDRLYPNEYVVGRGREVNGFSQTMGVSPPHGSNHFYPSDAELSDDSDQGARQSR